MKKRGMQSRPIISSTVSHSNVVIHGMKWRHHMRAFQVNTQPIFILMLCITTLDM